MAQEMKRYKLKICLLGDESVGKSSLIRKFVLDQFSDDYIPTLGTKITKKEIVLTKYGIAYDLILIVHDINGHWSTCGQTIEDFKKMVPSNYYINAEGLIFVCDLTRKDTFFNYDFWHDNLTGALGKDVPCVFLGNKVDLTDQCRITTQDIDEMGRNKGDFTFMYSSAKTGENVETAFKILAEKIISTL